MKLYRYHYLRERFLIENNGCWGEVAPLPGFSKETVSEAFDEIRNLWPDLSQANHPSVQFGWASAHTPFAPVHIPLASLKSPKEGTKTLKLKLGCLSLKEAISLVKKNTRYKLRLDFNRSWPLEKVVEFTRHFKPTDFDYLEEPVDNFNDLISFSINTQFPIALDESIHSNWSEIPTLKAIVVKPTVVGAIPKIPPHLDLILSSSYETGIGLIHVALLAQNKLPIGLDTYAGFKNDLLTTPIDCANGYFSWTPSKNPVNLNKLCEIAL